MSRRNLTDRRRMLELDPALRIECPQCGVPPGKPCIGHKPVHAARREKQYQQDYPSGGRSQ